MPVVNSRIPHLGRRKLDLYIETQEGSYIRLLAVRKANGWGKFEPLERKRCC